MRENAENDHNDYQRLRLGGGSQQLCAVEGRYETRESEGASSVFQGLGYHPNIYGR